MNDMLIKIVAVIVSGLGLAWAAYTFLRPRMNRLKIKVRLELSTLDKRVISIEMTSAHGTSYPSTIKLFVKDGNKNAILAQSHPFNCEIKSGESKFFYMDISRFNPDSVCCIEVLYGNRKAIITRNEMFL